MKTRLSFGVRALVAALLLATAVATFGGVRGVDARSCDPCPVVTTDALNLRSGPSLNDTIVWVIPKGTEVIAANARTNGFREVEVDGREGWAHAQYLVSPDVPQANSTRTTTDYVNFRVSPELDADIIDVVPPLTVVESTDQIVNSFRFVYVDGTPGWIYEQYLAGSATMTTTDYLNLRAEPSLSGDVLVVMTPGASVQLTGDELDGFVSVTYNGVDGWAYSTFLS
jgi:SH3-like domain-containing protein